VKLRRAALAVALLLVLVPAASARAAGRVVSLNLCTDQLLVLLAPEKVVALSPLASDPALSFVATQAARLPVVRPAAEAVLRLHPDLVLAARWGAQTALALIEAAGITVERLDLPQDFPAIRRQVRSVAALLGVPERGQALVATMDATLAGVTPPTHPPSVVVWEPRGYTAGPGSLMDAVLRAAGLHDASDGRRLGLEALLRTPPDLLVTPAAPGFPSLATDLLENPALRGIPRRSLPPALTLCAGPFTAGAVALLAR
jgi:iron complex transport system substrate-binding protein